jgi:golgi apyrase
MEEVATDHHHCSQAFCHTVYHHIQAIPPSHSSLKAGSFHPFSRSPVTNPDREDCTCPHPPRTIHGSTGDGLDWSLMLAHPAQGCKSTAGKTLPSCGNWKERNPIVVCQRWKRGHRTRMNGFIRLSPVRHSLETAQGTVILKLFFFVTGLSSFAENPKGVSKYLQPFLDYSRTHLPPSVETETPIFLLATAGMRLLTQEQQVEILKETCHFFQTQSNFRIDKPSSAGPCGSSIRIITGEEEGLFGWLSVNYLMDGFTSHSQDRTTYGFLDMGGASTQIAFEPSLAERNNPENSLIEVRLRLISGEEILHKVFVTTWLGYGTNQARERYVAQAVNTFESNRPTVSSSSSDVILDPCLPKGLRLVGQPLQLSSAPQHSKQPHTLVGTGSFEQCLEKTSPLLNKDAPCSVPPCLFDGVHVPPIDFSGSHFIGVSEYWYSTEHVFGLGGAYDFVQYERAAVEFCQRDWTDILQQHKDSRLEGGKELLGGDGEVEKDGRIVSVGKWGDNVEIPRLQMQCFKAAWIANVLHSGLGMPRIIDPKGNLTVTEGGPAVSAQAQEKGLGRPAFQSVSTVGDIAFSWTLGKMVLEASKEVPPLSSTTEPIVDPLDGWSRPHWMDSPFTFSPPFWDFDAIEDKLSDHLPTSLTRKSLGFSFVGFLFYIFMLGALGMVMWRLRFSLRATFKRVARYASRGRPGNGGYTAGRKITSDSYAMEEGWANGEVFTSPRSSPRSSLSNTRSSSTFKPLQRLTVGLLPGSSPHPRTSRPSAINTSLTRSSSWGLSQGSSKPSPSRSSSYPPPASLSNSVSPSSSIPNNNPPNSATGSSLSLNTSLSTGTAHQLTPSSPRLGGFDEAGTGTSLGSFYSTRSLNSSQMNLSSLVPRQPISRSNSVLHLPLDGD